MDVGVGRFLMLIGGVVDLRIPFRVMCVGFPLPAFFFPGVNWRNQATFYALLE